MDWRALRDRYAIVGVGETPYTRGPQFNTTQALAHTAVSNAIADAGLAPTEVDGFLSYSLMDSTPSTVVATDLGVVPGFHMDVFGGGGTTEALIGIAIGAMEVGMCRAVVIFRALNGYSGYRIGGPGVGGAERIHGNLLHSRPYGYASPLQQFMFTYIRHIHDHGTRREQAAAVKAIQSEHAANNPKALYRQPVSIDDVLASRMICAPVHLLDCCVETDGAAALIITDTEHAKDCRHTPVLVSGLVGRHAKPRVGSHAQHGPVSAPAGAFAKERLWNTAGFGPEDVDLTGAYDCFTYSALMNLQAFGFCAPGEAGDYVTSGITQLGGARPNNTSGGQLCEGYTHGLNLVVENVRQLRHDADDNCPVGPDGRRRHTYDYRPGGCRQVRDAEVAVNMGWGGVDVASALALRRG